MGTEPIARCFPNEGACPPEMFSGGVAAELGDPNLGAGVYSERCSQCHGARGQGIATTLGIDFRSAVWQARYDDAELGAIIINGRPPQMPPAMLDSAELRHVIAYVRNLAPDGSSVEVPSESPSAPKGSY